MLQPRLLSSKQPCVVRPLPPVRYLGIVSVMSCSLVTNENPPKSQPRKRYLNTISPISQYALWRMFCSLAQTQSPLIPVLSDNAGIGVLE
jgi:hypothetical protein